MKFRKVLEAHSNSISTPCVMSTNSENWIANFSADWMRIAATSATSRDIVSFQVVEVATIRMQPTQNSTIPFSECSNLIKSSFDKISNARFLDKRRWKTNF